MTLLSLASKQIWPQVLAVAHLKPERLFLLHSEDATESKGPAQRLRRLFDDSGLVPKGGTQLESLPHDDFSAIESRCDEIAAAKQELRSGERLIVNPTSGTKQMSAGATLAALDEEVDQIDFTSGERVDGVVKTRTEVVQSFDLRGFLFQRDLRTADSRRSQESPQPACAGSGGRRAGQSAIPNLRHESRDLRRAATLASLASHDNGQHA